MSTPTPRHHRPPRPWHGLIPFAALALGCSSTGGGGLGLRPKEPEVKTIAAIGDRPIAAKSGSTSSAVSDFEAARTSRSNARDDRVSGRVVDADGEPVPNATVRVADGGTRGGRVTEAISDRAGGFTLHGLRPGSSYQVIAEYEEKGRWIEGRAEVHVPSTGVEIAVQGDDRPSDRRRAVRTPAGRTVSDRVEDDRNSSGVNDEDLPAGRDDRDDSDQADARPAGKGTAVMVVGTGWHASRTAAKAGESARAIASSKDPSALGDRETLRASTHPLDEGNDPLPRARRRAADDPPPQAEDDEENPLPPALEPPKRRARAGDDDPDEATSAARPRRSRRVSDAKTNRPGPPPGALSSSTDGSEPEPEAQSEPATKPRRRVAEAEPLPEPAPAVEADALPAVGTPALQGRPIASPDAVRATQKDYPREPEAPALSLSHRETADAEGLNGGFALPPRPANAPAETPTPTPAFDPFAAPKGATKWGDLAGSWPRPEPAPERAGIVADAQPAEYESRAQAEPVRRVGLVGDRPSAPPLTKGSSVEACRYDARRLQIVDFRLPDLDGRPVTLGDFDAEYLLLDFWGTWCRPCLMSVPHLVEIQKKFEGRSVAVVGIACEEGPASASAAHVAEVAKRLGINYTVLISSKDDKASPMQEALHVSAYPTMIVIDRKGRVVWRAQGATTDTLARLDKILMTSTKSTETVRR